MRLAPTLPLVLLLAGCVATGPGSQQFGQIIAATPVDQPGQNSGAGAIAGMVAGGIVGGQFGAGAGKALAVAGGMIAGAAVGTTAESAAQSHSGMAYTIRLDNGEILTLEQHVDKADPPLPVGAPVILQTLGTTQRVVPRA